MTNNETDLDTERADILETLTAHRAFLRHTVAGLTDEQAALTPTASALCVGGLIKHVANTEEGWIDFILDGPSAMGGGDDWSKHALGFRMLPGETVSSILDRYAEVARRSDEVLATLPDLGLAHPLPAAPWFTPGAVRSARRVFLHIIAETSQHAGHADILRESIDGQKTMG